MVIHKSVEGEWKKKMIKRNNLMLLCCRPNIEAVHDLVNVEKGFQTYRLDDILLGIFKRDKVLSTLIKCTSKLLVQNH